MNWLRYIMTADRRAEIASCPHNTDPALWAPDGKTRRKCRVCGYAQGRRSGDGREAVYVREGWKRRALWN